jgi:hypothetical protein
LIRIISEMKPFQRCLYNISGKSSFEPLPPITADPRQSRNSSLELSFPVDPDHVTASFHGSHSPHRPSNLANRHRTKGSEKSSGAIWPCSDFHIASWNLYGESYAIRPIWPRQSARTGRIRKAGYSSKPSTDHVNHNCKFDTEVPKFYYPKSTFTGSVKEPSPNT